ncbi:MAG TPA: TIGR00725 family protein [Acidilobales archaeon]|nr:TIGR00725 family protein [Acidilobales archaeon]
MGLIHKFIQVGVACSSDPKPNPIAVDKAVRFAKELARFKNEVVLMTGGGGGLMTIVSKVFYEHGGTVMGFLPLEMEGVNVGHPRWNPYNTIEIYTSMSYQARSVPLVRSSDVLVCLGGDAGTLIEVLIAYLNRKPIICLIGTGYLTDKLPKLLDNEGYLDRRKLTRVIVEEDPTKAALKAYEIGKKTLKQHIKT